MFDLILILITPNHMKTNPGDIEAAKAAARRLYQKVNFSGGPLQSY